MTHANIIHWSSQLRASGYHQPGFWYDDLVTEVLRYIIEHHELYGEADITTRKTEEVGNCLMAYLN